MDAESRLEAHLLASYDVLLSLATLATACGRPELALAASTAIEPLLPFLDGIDGDAIADLFPDLDEDAVHAEH